MRALSKRVEAMERITSAPTTSDLCFAGLSTSEVARVQELSSSLATGEWTEAKELPTEDLRILAKVRVSVGGPYAQLA